MPTCRKCGKTFLIEQHSGNFEDCKECQTGNSKRKNSTSSKKDSEGSSEEESENLFSGANIGLPSTKKSSNSLVSDILRKATGGQD
jgi:hypothetical protein